MALLPALPTVRLAGAEVLPVRLVMAPVAEALPVRLVMAPVALLPVLLPVLPVRLPVAPGGRPEALPVLPVALLLPLPAVRLSALPVV